VLLLDAMAAHVYETLQNTPLAPVSSGWPSTNLVDDMPSIRSLSGFALSALGAAQSVLGLQSPVTRQVGYDIAASTTCGNTQLSCHNTSVVEDLCCFNAPGGSLLQTQFWDTKPVTGPVDSWTIHGLWVSSPPFDQSIITSTNCTPARQLRWHL